MTKIEKNLQLYEKIKTQLRDVQEVPTFKALCELLDEPVRNGTNKDKWIKEVLNKYITYDRIGRKFCNIKLREENEVKILELEQLFQDRLAFLLCTTLDRYYSITGNVNLFISNGYLGRALGLYNSYYLEILPDNFIDFESLSQKTDKLILNESNRRDYTNIGKLKKNIKENMRDQINGNFTFLNWILSKDIENVFSGEENLNIDYQKIFSKLKTNSVDDMINAFSNNDPTYFNPFIDSWEAAYQFLRHVPNSIKYKIDKTIERVQQYHLIQHFKRYVGVYKTEDDHYEEILLSPEQISDYFYIIFTVIQSYYKENTFKYIDIVLREKPDWYTKNLSEALEAKMGLIRIYQTNEFIFNPYVIRNLGNYFKNNILAELNTDCVRKIIRDVSSDIRKNLKENYERRLEKYPKSMSPLSQEQYDYLEKKTLSYNKSDFANSYDYINEEYNTNLKLYDKIFKRSLNLSESDNYELNDFKENDFRIDLFEFLVSTFKDNINITPDLFNVYYDKIITERDIPEDDVADLY